MKFESEKGSGTEEEKLESILAQVFVGLYFYSKHAYYIRIVDCVQPYFYQDLKKKNKIKVIRLFHDRMLLKKKAHSTLTLN